MPTVPMPIGYKASHFLYVEPLIIPPESMTSLDIKWVVTATANSTNSLGNTFASGAGDYSAGLWKEAIVNQSPYSPPPAIGPNQTPLVSTLATSQDPQGCSVVLHELALQQYAISPDIERYFAIGVDFTYPTEWDEGPLDAYYVWPIISGNLVFGYFSHTYSYGSVVMTGGMARPLITPRGIGSPIPELSNTLIRNYTIDETSIDITPRVPLASLSWPKPGRFYYEPPGGSQWVKVGSAWDEPAQPVITKFTWHWGDGEPDEDVAAGPDTPRDASLFEYNIRHDFLPATGIAHEYEQPTPEISVRATNSYGVKSFKAYITATKITGESRLAATHNVHGETFVAQVKTAPSAPGVSVQRAVKATRSEISFIADAKKPGIYHDASNQLFLGYVAPDSGVFTLYSTPDCGETWEVMTESPFNFDAYSPVVPCNGMSDGLHAVAGFKKRTTELWFSLYNGAEWTTPVRVTVLALNISKTVSMFQENFAGSSRLRIVGASFDLASTDYGTTWSGT